MLEPLDEEHLLDWYFLVMESGIRVFAQPSEFKLTIARKHKSESCTSGYLAVNGKVIAYARDLPWRGNAPLISSIPNGVYGGILRYDHADMWRIELTGVPGRTNVRIHTGNTPDDSEGCILVGSKLGDDLCSVIGSKKAYENLRIAFYGSPNPVSTPNKNITRGELIGRVAEACYALDECRAARVNSIDLVTRSRHSTGGTASANPSAASGQ
jgi:hypothetical protein